jgi:uncharacterized membrane protein
MSKKLKVFIACWGTVVAVAILCSMFLIIFGMNNKLELFFYLHFTIGAVIIFFIFWPFYSKRLK